MVLRFLTRPRLTSTKQTLESFFIRRAFASLPLTKSLETVSAPTLSLLRPRSLVAVADSLRNTSPAVGSSVRGFSTRYTTRSDDYPYPTDSDDPSRDEERPPLPGCDFKHWFVVVKNPDDENTTRDELIDSYIKMFAQAIGSEEEARKKIYSVSTKYYFGFGFIGSEELTYRITGVWHIVPDSYMDVKNKTYGGEPFINGQVVPYQRKFHGEWARRHTREERLIRNQSRRDPRAFERRREMDVYWSFVHSTGGNSGPQNMGPNNPRYACPNNIGGGMEPNDMSGMAPNNLPNPQKSEGAAYQSGPANQNSYMPNMIGGNPFQDSNMTGIPDNVPYSGAPHQSGPDSNKNSHAPTLGGGNPYQNITGGDIQPPKNY